MYITQANRGLALAPAALRRVAERGLALELDIYVVGDDGR